MDWQKQELAYMVNLLWFLPEIDPIFTGRFPFGDTEVHPVTFLEEKSVCVGLAASWLVHARTPMRRT